MNEDLRDVVIFLVCVITMLITMIIVVIYGLTYVNALTFENQRYDVTVTVQAVECSIRFGDHTNVWCLVYGDQDITYTFFGLQDFDVGGTYHIIFIDEIKFTPFGYQVWGQVIGKEKLGPL